MRTTTTVWTLALGLFATLAPVGAEPDPETPLATNDCFGGDAGNTFQSARTIFFGTNCTGNMDSTDLQDWYRVDSSLTAVTQSITFTVCPTTSWDPDITVFFRSGVNELLGSSPSSVGSSSNGSGVCDAVGNTQLLPLGGDWFLQVRLFSGSGAYTLSVS